MQKTDTAAEKDAKKGLKPRQLAAKLLARVVDDNRNLDALSDSEHGISEYLQLEPRDQALAKAIVRTCLRHRIKISDALGKCLERPLPKRARHLIHSMHVAAAQILFMEVPDRAAVDLGVTAIRSEPRSTRFSGVANAVLRRLSREKETLSQLGGPVFPAWFEKKLRSDYGKARVSGIRASFLKDASLDISVKNSPEDWAKRLEGMVLPNGSVRLTPSAAVNSLAGFQEGEWWVQDAAASIPATLFPAANGKRLLELCAAPGGKTAQLVCAGWQVTALDSSTVRLKRLETNLARLGLSAEIVNSDLFEYKPAERFDAVLLDAPCSSTGTIRRHPDIVWTKSAEDIKELAKLQYEMLSHARCFLAPGGTLVFSNCSIFKEEGENVLSRALQEFDDLELSLIDPTELEPLDGIVNGQGAIRTIPGTYPASSVENIGEIDGFFVCRFKKK